MPRLQLGRVTRMPLQAQAVNILREAIVSGAIRPGSRITEAQVASKVDLSRATVRTALQQLAKEGLLTLVPYTGWAVVSLSTGDVWELYTLRSAVERLAAQLVADSMDHQKAKALGEAFDKLTQACRKGTPAKIADADFGLHKTIIELARHGRLRVQYGFLEQQIRMCISSSDALISDPAVIMKQHRPIVDAIRSGKIALAGDLSEQHNLVEGEKLAAHLKGDGTGARRHCAAATQSANELGVTGPTKSPNWPRAAKR
jgi:DNA-binding GntR family transcriptional regulator